MQPKNRRALQKLCWGKCNIQGLGLKGQKIKTSINGIAETLVINSRSLAPRGQRNPPQVKDQVGFSSVLYLMIQKIKINVKSKSTMIQSADVHIWMFHVSQSASHHCLTGMKPKLSKQMCINMVLPRRGAVKPSFICLINFMNDRTELKKKVWLKWGSSCWLKSCVYLRVWVLPVLLPVAVVKQPMKDNEKYQTNIWWKKKNNQSSIFVINHP